VPTAKKTPFTTNVSVVDSPWTNGNKLIHIGIQGYQLAASEIPQSNLVFLLDVSGSMDAPDKLPLVKQSMGLLLDTLKPDDTISIVVYAGAAGTVLEPTKVKEKQKILAALTNLQAGGSTAGAEGIALAYQLAEANFNKDGVNRIILATDGDFNVGQTGDEALQDFVERKRDQGIYLSVLGFGQGNYQDALMQTLAQNGNGTAAYIDTLSEAQKVLVTEATSNLFPIAQDVKIQVEFNPNTVKEYRLIGYETRALNREDFNNDKVDAGEIGAGQRVTAIYEITPAGAQSGLLEESRYQQETKVDTKTSSEYAFLRLRYKLPGETQSQLLETAIEKNVLPDVNTTYQQEVNFSIAVAGFAQLLRGSNYAGDFTYDKVIELAQANKGKDEYGYRTEFVQLVRKAKIAQ
jgi:Ca-activated chloride channel family protein